MPTLKLADKRTTESALDMPSAGRALLLASRALRVRIRDTGRAPRRHDRAVSGLACRVARHRRDAAAGRGVGVGSAFCSLSKFLRSSCRIQLHNCLTRMNSHGWKRMVAETAALQKEELFRRISVNPAVLRGCSSVSSSCVFRSKSGRAGPSVAALLSGRQL
jgi:hypothetical protein